MAVTCAVAGEEEIGINRVKFVIFRIGIQFHKLHCCHICTVALHQAFVLQHGISGHRKTGVPVKLGGNTFIMVLCRLTQKSCILNSVCRGTLIIPPTAPWTLCPPYLIVLDIKIHGIRGVQSVQQMARAALENPRLSGEPEIRDTGVPQSDTAPAAGFNMGSAVPVAEPEWSAAHRCVRSSFK